MCQVECEAKVAAVQRNAPEAAWSSERSASHSAYPDSLTRYPDPVALVEQHARLFGRSRSVNPLSFKDAIFGPSSAPTAYLGYT